METSSKGTAYIGVKEGWVPRWYICPAGEPTIGHGFTWQSQAFREWWGKNRPGQPFNKDATMTRAEGAECLKFLLDREYGHHVDDFLSGPVPQHVFDGMVSPVFNLGPGSLAWKWAAACQRGDYHAAAINLRRTGITADGRVLDGLIRRRREEAMMIEEGVYPGIDPVRVGLEQRGDAMSDGVLQRGDAGPAVAELIKDLAALGYYDGRLDDIFGRGTEAAVVAFQEERGLLRDGIAGPATLAAVADALKTTAESMRPRSIGGDLAAGFMSIFRR